MDIYMMISLVIGLLIFVPSLVYLAVYLVFDVIVKIKKKNNRETIPTSVDGVREIKYNVSERLLKRHTKLKTYKPFANLGMAYGSGLIAIALIGVMGQMIKNFAG